MQICIVKIACQMITLENVSKQFGSVTALQDVSFEVAKGEVVGLLGPNGAGKTTTMRIITGFLEADLGSVTIAGIRVSSDSLKTRARIGYLPESAPLYLDMEVIDFLRFTGRLRNLTAPCTESAIDRVVVTCGLNSVAGRTIGKLSKGYRQRVGLAAALLSEPEILILDEPTSGLDPNQIVEIRSLIREIGKERTVILSTHIMQEVEATCSKAIIISGGRLVGHGTLAELLSHSKLCGGYVVGVKASRTDAANALKKLSGFRLAKWMSNETDAVSRFLVHAEGEQNLSEEIFNWAVASGVSLIELTPQEASLEDVFRELTVN